MKKDYFYLMTALYSFNVLYTAFLSAEIELKRSIVSIEIFDVIQITYIIPLVTFSFNNSLMRLLLYH